MPPLPNRCAARSLPLCICPPDWPRVVILGAMLSGTIETLQLFSPTRYTSLLDLATNSAGAAVGAWLFARLARRLEDDTAVQSLALELPLMGLVYQLIPLCWLIGLGSEGGARRIFVLPVAAFAGAKAVILCCGAAGRGAAPSSPAASPSQARVSAVDRPRAMSAAKLGPVRTATRAAGQAAASTPEGPRPVSRSTPLQQAISTRPSRRGP